MNATNFIKDLNGKPSTMRLASLVAVLSGCFILVATMLGYSVVQVQEEAVWLVGIGLAGKWSQRWIEENKHKGE